MSWFFSWLLCVSGDFRLTLGSLGFPRFPSAFPGLCPGVPSVSFGFPRRSLGYVRAFPRFPSVSLGVPSVMSGGPPVASGHRLSNADNSGCKMTRMHSASPDMTLYSTDTTRHGQYMLGHDKILPDMAKLSMTMATHCLS